MTAAFGQCHYLRIYDTAGVTYHRWQTFYVGRTVSWDNQQWIHQPFEASGIVVGQTGDEGGVSITVPATRLALDAMHTAMSAGHSLELRVYQWDLSLGDGAPLAGQELVASFIGEIVQASATLTSMTLELGSALSPVGAQIPPRTMTTRLIGKGCKL